MSVALYMDVHVAMEITERLRRAGVDVMTAQEDGAELLPDEGILERAGTLGRALFTQDQDFLVMAAKLQLAGVGFAGIFFAHHQPTSNGEYAKWLEVYATLGSSEEFEGRVTFIP
jgi:hypothetical protein